MQLLLRKLSITEDNETEIADFELTRDTVVLGSAPDCDIQLLGKNIQGKHATIRKNEHGFLLQAKKGLNFLHNGKPVKQAQLNLDDQLVFDQHILKVSKAPAGFEFALEWEPAEVDGRFLANAYKTKLSQIRWNNHAVTWLLAITVFVVAGVLPLGDYWLRTTTQTQDPSANLHQAHYRYTADSFWISGPLHSAHTVALGTQCEICHQRPFEQVTDQACENCHNTMSDHLDPAHEQVALLEGARCQNCHKEHNEPPQLVNRQDSLCTDCHSELEPSITGFGDHRHPQFRLTLFSPEVQRSVGSLTVNWQESKQALDLNPRENNHLKFSHSQHLDIDKVRDLGSDQALECKACHQLSADQEHFVPISMEKHCSDCHDLTFDPKQPKKQLPHANIDHVFALLEAHFINKAFDESDTNQRDRRRLPGRDDDEENCRGDYACARSQAIREADRQFSRRGCVTCHEVEVLQGVDTQARWQVLPARIGTNWFPAADFNHQSHLTQSGEAGSALCLSCHAADTSDNSHDVLIPGINNCQECHADASVSNRVQVECVSCHRYHPHE